jgi:sugar lactone lactonase YvrE
MSEGDTLADGILRQASFGSNGPNEESGDANLNAASLSFPLGVAVDTSVTPNRLYVADSKNNRVLGWNSVPSFNNGAPADLVIGQPDLVSSIVNNGSVSASSLDYPVDVAVDAAGNLYVADQGNNRVLEYNSPFTTDTIADLVFGQSEDFSTNSAPASVTANSLNAPSSVAVDGAGNLYVSDGENRVLEYDKPLDTDTTADRVFGQPDFVSTTCNNGGIWSNTLCNQSFAKLGRNGTLYVSDSGNNRVLIFKNPASKTAADTIIGQTSFTSTYCPATFANPSDATRLCSPVGLATDSAGNLYVADSGENRVLEYEAPLSNGEAASHVFGQPDFSSIAANNDEGFGPAGLSAPQGLAFDDSGNLYVADGGNNRVLMYEHTAIIVVTPTPTSTITPAARPTPTHVSGAITEIQSGSAKWPSTGAATAAATPSPTPVPGAITEIQSGGTTWSSTTTASPTFPSGTTTGNIVIVTVAVNRLTVVPSLSMAGVSKWYNLANDVGVGAQAISNWVFGGVVTTGGAKTLSVSLPGSSSGGVTMMEFSNATLNVDDTSYYEQIGGGRMSEYTPRSANTLLISLVGNAGAVSVTTPFSSPWQNQTVQTSGVTNYTSYQIQTIATPVQTTCNLSSNSYSTRVLVVGLQAANTTTAAYMVQSTMASVANVSGGTGLTTSAITPSASNALIMIAGTVGLGTNALTVSDGTNMWQRASSVANGTSASVEVWYAMNVAGSSVTPQITWSGNGSVGVTLMEWAGLATSSMLDVGGSGTTGSSTSLSTSTVSTSNATDLIIGAGGANASQWESAPLSNMFDSAGTYPFYYGTYGASQIVSATGSYSTTFHLYAAQAWAGVAAAFKLQSPTPTPTPTPSPTPAVRGRNTSAPSWSL